MKTMYRMWFGRQLFRCIKEHKPVQLRTGTRKFLADPAGTGYQMNDEIFKVIYKVLGDPSKGVRHLATMESTVTKLLDPTLGSQNHDWT